MARYIDMDEFYKSQIRRCGCVPLVGSCTMDNVSLREVLEQTPTADVVPRETVEELINENESLAKTVNEASELIHKLRRKADETKAKTAREIFAEIYEDCIDQFGYMDYEALAELKKKYIGEQNDEKH